jgi:hypothetical protein
VKKSDWPGLGLAHASARLGIPVADVEFLRACGVLHDSQGGIEEESLERFLADAGTVPDGVAHAVLALRTEWDRALVERGPAVGRRAFGAVELGQHPDGTVVFAVEKALDRIVARNLEVLGGGRIRQLIVDRSLMERWGERPDLLEKVPGAVIERLPREMAWRLRIVPVEWTGKKLVVASVRPLDFIALDDLRFMLGTEVDVVLVDEAALGRALERYYGREPVKTRLAMAELSLGEVQQRLAPAKDEDLGGGAAVDGIILDDSTVVNLRDVARRGEAGKSSEAKMGARPKPSGRIAPAAQPAMRPPEPPPAPASARFAPPMERESAIAPRKATFAPPPPPMPPMQAVPSVDPFAPGSGGGGWTPPVGSPSIAQAVPAAEPVAYGAVFEDSFAAASSVEPRRAPMDEGLVEGALDALGSDEAMETQASELAANDDTRELSLARKKLDAPSGARLAARSRGAPQAAPPAPKKDEDEAETFERKATVRYYEQMYARHNYPLLVVVSKRSIQQIVKQHVAQVESKKSFKIRRGNPFVTVRPILPGCLSVPAEITLDVKPKVAEAKFWVTPTAEGVLEDARVEVVYEGKVVSTIAVPTRVTTQTVAKLTGSAAFLSTTAGPFFEAFGISVKKAGASFVADLLADMAGGSMRFGMAGVLAFLALVFFLRRRPRAGPETEGFFDWGVEEEVEGDPLVRAVKAKLVVLGPEGRDVVDVVHGTTLVGGSETAHVRVRGARSLPDVACELRYDDTFFVRARASGVRVNGEDLREGEERKLGRDGVVSLDSDRVTLWLLDLRQDAALDSRREDILEALVRARPSFERELRAIWKRTASEPVRAALLEAVTSAFADPDGWRRVRESLRI